VDPPEELVADAELDVLPPALGELPPALLLLLLLLPHAVAESAISTVASAAGAADLNLTARTSSSKIIPYAMPPYCEYGSHELNSREEGWPAVVRRSRRYASRSRRV
jgi:hypothetical protein